MSFNIDNLGGFSNKQLIQETEIIGNRARSGKVFSEQEAIIESLALLVLSPPEFERLSEKARYLDDLISLASEKGLSNRFRDRITSIRNRCDEILPKITLIPALTDDILREVFSYLDPKEIARVRRVEKAWNRVAPKEQIKVINEKKLSLRSTFGRSMTAKQVVEWFIKNPSCSLLEYANFDGFFDFDNDCLEKLTKNCPRLKHLFIPECRISNDALKHLVHTPSLLSLNIACCDQLEEDALKHLEHTPGLKKLNIRGCVKLERDALKHLEHTPKLLSLDITYCNSLEKDAPKRLIHTPGLLSLTIASCNELQEDALKHLEYTPGLKKLNIRGCVKLERDALKHLVHTPSLQNLNIQDCHQLDEDALKHLVHTPKLLSLDILSCGQLDTGGLPTNLSFLLASDQGCTTM